MCIWGGEGESALVPKINPGSPVPQRGRIGGAHFFKTRKKGRPRQPFTSPSSAMGVVTTKDQGQELSI